MKEPMSGGRKKRWVLIAAVGVVLAIVLGAANAYLGLKAGMTVAAAFLALRR